MGIFGWVVLIFLAIFAAILIIAGISRSNEAEKLARHRADEAKWREEYATQKAAFINNEFSDQKIFDVHWDGYPAVLSAPDDALIRVVQFSRGRNFSIGNDHQYFFHEIRAVSYEENDVVEHYSRETVTPVVIQKNKSAIGRGLLGGALLGPVGLALGAASSLTSESSVEHVRTTQRDQRINKGPPSLVITTRERDNPFVRLEFSNADQARGWALWLGDQVADVQTSPAEASLQKAKGPKISGLAKKPNGLENTAAAENQTDAVAFGTATSFEKDRVKAELEDLGRQIDGRGWWQR